MHKDIDPIFRGQNVNYTEITTHNGRREVYKKFGFSNGKHPIFLILNKHPLSYEHGDPLMVIEWGKWGDLEDLKDDLMIFANCFSDTDIRNQIIDAKKSNAWKKLQKFFQNNGLSFLGIGATIGAALI